MSLPFPNPVDAPSGAPRRIEYIDGLRALAVLGVVISHVAYHRWGNVAEAHFALEGAHGVDLFFILSGFCLAFPTLMKLKRAGQTSFDAVSFGAKRLVRILPPFYIATALLVVAFVAIPMVLHPGRPARWEFTDIVAPLFFLDGNANLINPSFWTLIVEFRWYLAFPLLLALWVKSPRAFIALGVLLVIGYHFTRARGLDLGTLPGFMLGIIAAAVYEGTTSPVWSRRAGRLSIPLALGFAMIGVLSEPFAKIPGLAYAADVVWPFQPTILGWQLAMFFLVVAAGEHNWLRRALSIRVLVATGVASYGIYLVHEPVVEVIENFVRGPLGAAAAFVVAVSVGFVFWFVAERPFTTGRLRAPLVRWTTNQLARAFALLHLGRSLTLVDPAAAPVASLPDRAPGAQTLVAVAESS